MNDQNNPILSLTPNQTTELRQIWEQQKQELHPDDYRFIKVKLSRPVAKLSQKQAYRMMMTLAETDYEPIPEWLIALFDPKDAKWAQLIALGINDAALQSAPCGARYWSRKWLKGNESVACFLNTKSRYPDHF